MLCPSRCQWIANMKLIGVVTLLAAAAVGAPGCTGIGTKSVAGAPTVEHSDPSTRSGREAAVVNVNMRTSYQDACKYGVTLTNNLPYKITNISIRFAAYLKNGVQYDEITRNFFEVKPTEHQFREITFGQITCPKIDHIEVLDPGRCAMGKLTRFSAQPGDCGKYVDVAPSPYVRMYKK
jgi:hypothetical protein